MAEFDAVIEKVTKLNNSDNGNPTYRLHLAGGATLVTEVDGQIGHLIGNSEYLNVPVTIKTTQLHRVRAVVIKGEGGK